MKLIFINEIGSDYKGQKQYEFLFSDNEEIEMDNWFTIPASSVQESKNPDKEYVNIVGLLKDTDLKLDLIQNSDYFGVIDAVEGIISLGWEIFDYDLEISRLSFKFGESIDSVEEKLKNRNYKLTKQ